LLALFVLAAFLGCQPANSYKGTDAENWHRVNVLDGKLTLEFPAEPNEQSRTVESKVGQVTITMHKAFSDGVFYNLLITPCPPSVLDKATPQDLLVRMAKGAELQKSGAERVYFLHP
jgi:hypothetical protein